MFIFHKTEVFLINLRCLMGVYLNWFKSYGLRCSERPCECSVNSKNVETDKWPFYDHVWPIFVKYMVIFHKTEIQTVILRCLTSLNLNWFQRYDEKRKNAKNANILFFYVCSRHRKWKYLHFVS
jgi:hypothetical protein